MDAEIYDKAHAIMTSRRKKAEMENDERIKAINEKIPEIKEINDMLFNTGMEIIMIMKSYNGADVSKKIEEIKQKNLGAQEMAEHILISNGYPADYLNIKYSCPACNDTGYIGSDFCECMKNLFGKLMTEKLNKDAHIELTDFDSFSLKYYQGKDLEIMEKIFDYSKNYARNFNPDSESIIMSGDTGLGKTHLSLAIANAVLQKGYGVMYDSVINILWNIEKEHFSYEHSDILNTVLEADLLILDDFGTEQETSFYKSMIYNIINTRLVRNKPTIISTNMDYTKIKQCYGGKVSSRIATMYKYLKFQGDDVRLQIFKEKKAASK